MVSAIDFNRVICRNNLIAFFSHSECLMRVVRK